MTNRDKINALSNREMAVLWDYIKSDCAGSNCVFNACPDCGGDCLKGFEAWLGLECEAEENPPADKIDKPRKHLPRETLNSKTMINNVTADNVNHPAHYNRDGAMECIREMVVVFGYEATINFCKLNAWKYRYRANEKNGAEDMAKSDWYVKKADELKSEAGYF